MDEVDILGNVWIPYVIHFTICLAFLLEIFYSFIWRRQSGVPP